MVRRVMRYISMAGVMTRCVSRGWSVDAARLSASPIASSSPMSFQSIGSSRARPASSGEGSLHTWTNGVDRGPLRTQQDFKQSTGMLNSRSVNNYVRRGSRSSRNTRMTASAALSTAAATTQISRPAGAGKLHSIDFNPTVRATGSGALTPVVIMHGLLGNSRNFLGWGAKLVKSLEQERRVFAVDMRNHGASSHHDSMTYVDMADDIMGFLSDQGLSEAVLLGHSMGGKAAAMTALLHPEAVKGLVVMDIAPVSYSMARLCGYHSLVGGVAVQHSVDPNGRVDQTNWGETQKIIEAIHKMPLEGVGSRRDADQRLAKDVVDPALRAFAVTNLDKDPATGTWDWRINIDAIQRSMGVLAQFDSGQGHRRQGALDRLSGRRQEDAEEMTAFGGDTMFIAGGNSRYVRSQHLPQIEKLFPRFTVSTVRGAGHWVHADNPAETLRLAKSFLDRPELG